MKKLTEAEVEAVTRSLRMEDGLVNVMLATLREAPKDQRLGVWEGVKADRNAGSAHLATLARQLKIVDKVTDEQVLIEVAIVNGMACMEALQKAPGLSRRVVAEVKRRGATQPNNSYLTGKLERELGLRESKGSTTWEHWVAGAVTGSKFQGVRVEAKEFLAAVPDDAEGSLIADVARNLGLDSQVAVALVRRGRKPAWAFDFFRHSGATWVWKWPVEYFDRLARVLKAEGERMPNLYSGVIQEIRDNRRKELSDRFWLAMLKGKDAWGRASAAFVLGERGYVVSVRKPRKR